jgi:polysaccharide export outer membrane protein
MLQRVTWRIAAGLKYGMWISVACVGCQSATVTSERVVPVATVPAPAPAPVAAPIIAPGARLACKITDPTDPQGGSTQVVTVRPDGTIDLGAYGTVMVGGMTTIQAQGAITERLNMTKSTNVTSAAPMQPAPVQRVAYRTAEPPSEPVQPVSPPAHAPVATLGAPHIACGSTLSWSIKDLPGAPGSRVGGRNRVGPDGRLDLGEYGTVAVAGLTPAEAEAVIQDHLIRRFRPTETVATAAPAAIPSGLPAQELRLKPVATGRPVDANLRPVSYQGAPAAVAQATNPVPAGDPLPAPRTVPQQPQQPQQQFQEGVVIHGPETGPGCQGGAHLGAPAPRELAMASLPPYVLDPPDVLLIESTQGLRDQPIRGQHLIRPDGTISLGIYGSVHVAGLTLDQARAVVGQVFAQRIKDFDPRNLDVDVLAYNSKVYYVITDGAGYGEQVYRVPVTGSETVLDAIAQINGLPPVASKRKIWIARRTPGDGGPGHVLPVDWKGITQGGITATNYQVLPGDRIYVKADCLMRIDTALAKFLSPIQRVLGVTLLGGATVSSVSGAGSGTGLASGFIVR